MIAGIGVDIVDLQRFQIMIERTPHLLERVFTDAERTGSAQTLAATFAAKEAVAKALGAPAGLDWHDVEVRHEDSGRPYLQVVGTIAAFAAARGITRWQVSLSHDAGTAIAMVIAESEA